MLLCGKCQLAVAYSVRRQKSKMEHFAKIVNGLNDRKATRKTKVNFFKKKKCVYEQITLIFTKMQAKE